jgi:ribosomal protein S27E
MLHIKCENCGWDHFKLHVDEYGKDYMHYECTGCGHIESIFIHKDTEIINTQLRTEEALLQSNT